MSTDKFTVALVQMSCGPEPQENLKKALERVADAARSGAHVVCLPELFQTQYFCQREDTVLFDLAEPIPGLTTEKLSAVARENHVVLVASLFEKRAAGVYHNTAAIFNSDGKLEGIYRKMHIPDDPLYYEKYYFTPGDLGYRTFNTSAGKLGALVCWDQWYPEGARLTALQGASILFYPTAIGWHPAEKAEFGIAQHDAWRTIQRAHAIANGVYVGVVNRVGFETGNIRGNVAKGEGLEFWGGSFLSDPFGSPSLGRHPSKLALFTRPPHRQLRANYQPDDRLAGSGIVVTGNVTLQIATIKPIQMKFRIRISERTRKIVCRAPKP